MHEFVAKYIELCNPESVFVATDSKEDIDYIRESAIQLGEEKPLKIKGHTIHFDGYYDQARDKKNTRILVPEGYKLEKIVNTMSRQEGIEEIRKIMKNIMKGKKLFIRFFCLGPLYSEFSIPCVQLTDSAYVAHNEDLLYRHENAVSSNVDKRRIYIDLEENTVYSANTQYGGNTIGLKKLAVRLAILKGSKEGWLCEHMFLMGIRGPGGRTSYFTGAYPSLCGKTSTSMVEGEKIVGDDIVYLRKRKGSVYGMRKMILYYGRLSTLKGRSFFPMF